MKMTIHQQIKKSEYVLFADEEILIVLDIDPITKGHILILPQKGYKDIDEIPELILNRIFKAAQVYCKIIKTKYLAKGYSIMQNGGAYNDIGVFHLHVFPRFRKNEFDYKKRSIKDVENRNEIMKLLEIEIMKTRENNT